MAFMIAIINLREKIIIKDGSIIQNKRESYKGRKYEIVKISCHGKKY
jgi:hypothetical protein